MTDYTLIKGVDKLFYALVTQDDAAAYAAGTPAALAPLKLAAQTPAANTKTDYYDNQPMFNFNAEGETKLKVDVTNLPLSLQAVLLGKVYDAVNDSLYDNGGTPPDVALGFRAKMSNGDYKLFWFLKGKFKPFDEESAAETDTPDPKGFSLEYTAVRTVHQFDLNGSITDSVKRRVSTKQADVATWFDAVRVPVVGSPDAFTCTPSPADAATGVAVSVSPTLTFSNPLAGDAERGIMLTSAAGVAVAAVRSLNAARTVVTINPNSDLDALTEYLIIVAGVTDVYGQSLANTVYDFETA